VWHRAGFDRDYVVEQVLNGEKISELVKADELGPVRAAEIEAEAKAIGKKRWALRRLLYRIAREKSWTLRRV